MNLRKHTLVGPRPALDEESLRRARHRLDEARSKIERLEEDMIRHPNRRGPAADDAARQFREAKNEYNAMRQRVEEEQYRYGIQAPRNPQRRSAEAPDGYDSDSNVRPSAPPAAPQGPFDYSAVLGGSRKKPAAAEAPAALGLVPSHSAGPGMLKKITSSAISHLPSATSAITSGLSSGLALAKSGITSGAEYLKKEYERVQREEAAQRERERAREEERRARREEQQRRMDEEVARELLELQRQAAREDLDRVSGDAISPEEYQRRQQIRSELANSADPSSEIEGDEEEEEEAPAPLPMPLPPPPPRREPSLPGETPEEEDVHTQGPVAVQEGRFSLPRYAPGGPISLPHDPYASVNAAIKKRTPLATDQTPFHVRAPSHTGDTPRGTTDSMRHQASRPTSNHASLPLEPSSLAGIPAAAPPTPLTIPISPNLSIAAPPAEPLTPRATKGKGRLSLGKRPTPDRHVHPVPEPVEDPEEELDRMLEERAKKAPKTIGRDTMHYLGLDTNDVPDSRTVLKRPHSIEPKAPLGRTSLPIEPVEPKSVPKSPLPPKKRAVSSKNRTPSTGGDSSVVVPRPDPKIAAELNKRELAIYRAIKRKDEEEERLLPPPKKSSLKKDGTPRKTRSDSGRKRAKLTFAKPIQEVRRIEPIKQEEPDTEPEYEPEPENVSEPRALYHIPHQYIPEHARAAIRWQEPTINFAPRIMMSNSTDASQHSGDLGGLRSPKIVRTVTTTTY